jgi:hypothetical protein
MIYTLHVPAIGWSLRYCLYHLIQNNFDVEISWSDFDSLLIIFYQICTFGGCSSDIALEFAAT